MAGISSDSSNVLGMGTGEQGKLRYYHYADYLAPDRQRLVPDRRHGRSAPAPSARWRPIAHGTSANLIHRAADVHLKERPQAGPGAPRDAAFAGAASRT